ncbi:UNVERIFIED_CONTAM: hypothetical protein Sangu_2520300 [Sesamum angustifolium]|uniref:Tf2-1-like SH3-like domain-containing protein n=1 Tax=Sesamum angustifolium TaxID=2727405 RepID=A0AAW2JI99_9LAMI
MKLYADKKRSKREFEVGDEAFLKLQPYKQTSVALRKPLKLYAKYFGPYKVLEKVGKVAYKLAQPPEAKIPPIFHVSLLKKKIRSKYFSSIDLIEFEDEIFKVYYVAILSRRLMPKNNVVVVQLLIQRSHASPDQATWEDYSVIASRFLGFDLWGQGVDEWTSGGRGRKVAGAGGYGVAVGFPFLKLEDIKRSVQSKLEKEF